MVTSLTDSMGMGGGGGNWYSNKFSPSRERWFAGIGDGSFWDILRLQGHSGPVVLAALPTPSLPGCALALAYKESGWGEDENLSGCGHGVFNTPFMGPRTAPSGIISFCLPFAWPGDSCEMGVERCEEGEPRYNLC